MRMSELICTAAVLEGGSAVGKEELIRQLLLQLANDGHLTEADVPSVLEAVMRRERLATTGIGRGIAMPHGKHPDLQRRIAILGVCRKPVVFESIDGEPADIFVLTVAPHERPGGYMKLYPGAEDLMRRLGDVRFTERLRQSKSAEEIAAFLRAADGLP